MTATGDDSRGFLVTFKPCGHVQHSRTAPAEDSWLSCWVSLGGGCQTSRQVVKAEACPGCPQCPGQRVRAGGWRQPALFGEAA